MKNGVVRGLICIRRVCGVAYRQPSFDVLVDSGGMPLYWPRSTPSRAVPSPLHVAFDVHKLGREHTLCT